MISRRCHLGDGACVSNFAHALTTTRVQQRPPPVGVRSGDREEAHRGRGAPRSGHSGEKPRKTGKCWPIVQSNAGLPNILLMFGSILCPSWAKSRKGPRRRYYNPIPGMLFPLLKKNRSIFRISYTISSIIEACETRLTENGLRPERKLHMVSLTY